MARYSIDGQILTDMADITRVIQGEKPPHNIAASGTIASVKQWSSQTVSYNAIAGQRYCFHLEAANSLGTIGIVTQETKSVSAGDATEVEFYFIAPETAESTVRFYPQNHALNAVVYILTAVDENNEPMNVYGKSYTPEEMVTALEVVPPLPQPITLTGDCSSACVGLIGSSYISMYGNSMSTSDIGAIDKMFYLASTLKAIPFDINCLGSSYQSMNYMFYGCSALTKLPNVYNAYPSTLQSFCGFCSNLREIPEDFGSTWNWNRIHTYTSTNIKSMFSNCYSLRKIPESLLKQMWTLNTTSSNNMYSDMFVKTYTLDEIVGVGVSPATFTSNMFNTFVSAGCRLKNLIFATNEDGTPQTANWKNQTINLANELGYVSSVLNVASITNYNSGITADKEVKDDATYQALKDDPDWFTFDAAYSRYNHDSAVNTINSLPDTSAYITANGGTNTIKFQGAAGSATDGGACNTLTEEEIAVATAKGWTVTFA